MNNIDEKVQELSNKDDQTLLSVIGAYALSQNPEELGSSLAVNGVIDTTGLQQAGKRFLEYLRPILQEALCGPDGIAELIQKPTVEDVINILLPALGLSQIGFVPTALVAVAIIIVRAGIREYCKGI